MTAAYFQSSWFTFFLDPLTMSTKLNRYGNSYKEIGHEEEVNFFPLRGNIKAVIPFLYQYRNDQFPYYCRDEFGLASKKTSPRSSIAFGDKTGNDFEILHFIRR